jgi:DNA-binding transcriptional MerR regulator
MGKRRTAMKRRRHTPEQIVRKLREADRMLAEGVKVSEVSKVIAVRMLCCARRARRYVSHQQHPPTLTQPSLRRGKGAIKS